MYRAYSVSVFSNCIIMHEVNGFYFRRVMLDTMHLNICKTRKVESQNEMRKYGEIQVILEMKRDRKLSNE